MDRLILNHQLSWKLGKSSGGTAIERLESVGLEEAFEGGLDAEGLVEGDAALAVEEAVDADADGEGGGGG